MMLRVGIENNNEGYRSIAWGLEHPGCYAYGPDADSALLALAETIPDYRAWIESHEPAWLPEGPIEFALDSAWTDYDIDPAFERVEKGDYTVESFFQHDWQPLNASDIERGLKLLSWMRADLLAVIAGLTNEKKEQERPGERWSINGILNHIGGAEWWYLDRLGLSFPREKVPRDPMERLVKVRQHFVKTLPTLEGSRLVLGVDGEFWSPRKALRRAAWHEHDHIGHIRKLAV
ncbi:MAG: DinB family protein [Chloroflexi bacterium]|nr:DinB family protein [Chloroflexota bacterium]